ncbi:LIM domain only protein 3 [Anabrus simplex]|uniref:LIM domain only protein 3 n=1 Tax=Anabrus simplex TaxID=316456 RepID=UPI0035A2BE13
MKTWSGDGDLCKPIFTNRSSMTMDVKAESQKNTSTPQECAGCGKKITERFLLKALDLFWHEDCLKCGCCDCRLGEVGSTLYTKADLILCRRDYLRLFGNTGYCAACSKMIPAFEMVMRARNNVYHLECFACQQCNHRFCVGDRFYLCENKILCEYDYEERLVFANLAYNPSSLAHIKRQATHLAPGVVNGGAGQTTLRAPTPASSGDLNNNMGHHQMVGGATHIKSPPVLQLGAGR